MTGTVIGGILVLLVDILIDGRQMMELEEAIQCWLECDGCGRRTGGFGIDESYLAEESKKEGWRVTRAENVLCPDCKRVKCQK
jgi:hypothetical protein